MEEKEKSMNEIKILWISCLGMITILLGSFFFAFLLLGIPFARWISLIGLLVSGVSARVLFQMLKKQKEKQRKGEDKNGTIA